MRHVPTTGGLTLAVHELGGSGRPTLFSHATGFHGAVWEPLAALLTGTLQQWAIDLRAHGASTVPPELPLDWHDFRDDVLSVVDGLDLPYGEVLGIGHSLGGAALVLAEQARPGTFAGLWLYEPIVPPSGRMPSGPNAMSDAAERRRASFPSVAEAVANYASKPPLNRLRSDALHAYVRHGLVAGEDGAMHLACRPADEAQTFRGAGAHAAFDHLGEVRCPVVIGTGDEGVGPELFAQAVAEALPIGRLEQFDHLGHFGPLEAPPRVAVAIRRFAAELDL